MSERAVMLRPLGIMSGVGLVVALALAVWVLPRTDEVVDVASAKANAKPGLWAASASASGDWRTPTTPAMGPAMPSSALALAPTAFPVPVTVAAPQKLQVGEMNELVVGLGRNSGVGEVSFTVLFDPDVLQARGGTEGDWATGVTVDAPAFAAEVSDEGDQVQIRRAVSDQQVGVAGGSVAIVQFQSVAPGKTSVLITDVVVKDWAGRSMASAVSAATLQVTVDAVPAPQPEASRELHPVVVEPPTVTTEDGD